MNQTADELSHATPAPQQAPYPAPAAALNDPRRKSPFLASFLSIVPGLGQIYVGYYKQGFINILVTGGIISLLSSGDLGALIPLLSIFLAFFWFYNIVDAGRRAALYNQALAGGGDIELPEGFETPGLRGSIAGGGTLVVIGFVLLLHTRFGMSLAWVEEWWPVAVIAFGGYLIYRAMRDEATPESAAYDED